MNRKELTKDIYDNFKLKKKLLVSMVYTKIFQRCNPIHERQILTSKVDPHTETRVKHL